MTAASEDRAAPAALLRVVRVEDKVVVTVHPVAEPCTLVVTLDFRYRHYTDPVTLWSVCVCVCVRDGERERERGCYLSIFILYELSKHQQFS